LLVSALSRRANESEPVKGKWAVAAATASEKLCLASSGGCYFDFELGDEFLWLLLEGDLSEILFELS